MVWQGSGSYEQREFERRLNQIFIIAITLFVILTARLFYLQIIRGSYYARVAESNRTQIFFQAAPRGVMYDRNQQPLVDNKPNYVVLFSPLKLSPDVFASVMKSLGKILAIPGEQLMNMVSNKKSSAVLQLAKDIARPVLFRLLECRPDLPGVTVTSEPLRRYPLNAWGSHLFGHLGEINTSELARRIHEGYKLGDIIGKSGLERVYDYYIRGKPGGLQLEIDATGRSQKILYNIASTPGNDLLLTIDKRIQEAAENQFVVNKYIGAAVVIDPWSGKVLALVSSPNYDPNVFLKPIDASLSRELFFSEDTPMFNRSVQGGYDLGSVFKVITTIAALESKSFSPHRTIICHGSFKLGKKEFKCWEKKGHGEVDMLQAFTHSCDVYFYQLGLATGLEPLVRFGKLFGFGSLTQIDLPDEKKGIMPDSAWKKQARHEGWYDGDTVNLAIGQGFLNVTPVQVANMMAAVASRGKLFRPYCLEKIIDPAGQILLDVAPKLVREIELQPETWAMIDRCLKNVINNGTGMACQIAGLEIGGKTATAQNPQGDDHAWFTAYASLPREQPRIAIAVLIEHGVHGASAAAPVAREIIRAAFPELQETVRGPKR